MPPRPIIKECYACIVDVLLHPVARRARNRSLATVSRYAR